MRITTRLATAGEAGFLSMPALPHPVDHYMADGKFDQDAVRRDLANTPGVQMSSDDAGDTLSFTAELLDRMKCSMANHMRTHSETKPAGHGPDAPKTAAQRRFDKGRLTFVRVDIGRLVTGFRVRLSATNPRNVVGRSEEFARIYAQAFADNIVAIADALQEESRHVNVTLQEGEGCEGVFAEARRRNDLLAAKARHTSCPCRKAGYCSPSKPECELYNKENGRCRFDE
jgi:hypothetical protein